MSKQDETKSLWRKPPAWMDMIIFIETLCREFECVTKVLGCLTCMAAIVCVFCLCPIRIFIAPLVGKDYTWKNTDRWIYYRCLAMIYYSMFFIYHLIILVCMRNNRKIFDSLKRFKFQNCCYQFCERFFICFLMTIVSYNLFCPLALIIMPNCFIYICFDYVTKYNEYFVDINLSKYYFNQDRLLNSDILIRYIYYASQKSWNNNEKKYDNYNHLKFESMTKYCLNLYLVKLLSLSPKVKIKSGQFNHNYNYNCKSNSLEYNAYDEKFWLSDKIPKYNKFYLNRNIDLDDMSDIHDGENFKSLKANESLKHMFRFLLSITAIGYIFVLIGFIILLLVAREVSHGEIRRIGLFTFPGLILLTLKICIMQSLSIFNAKIRWQCTDKNIVSYITQFNNFYSYDKLICTDRQIHKTFYNNKKLQKFLRRNIMNPYKQEDIIQTIYDTTTIPMIICHIIISYLPNPKQDKDIKKKLFNLLDRNSKKKSKDKKLKKQESTLQVYVQ